MGAQDIEFAAAHGADAIDVRVAAPLFRDGTVAMGTWHARTSGTGVYPDWEPGRGTGMFLVLGTSRLQELRPFEDAAGRPWHDQEGGFPGF